VSLLCWKTASVNYRNAATDPTVRGREWRKPGSEEAQPGFLEGLLTHTAILKAISFISLYLSFSAK
jgi:hypothetical protein